MFGDLAENLFHLEADNSFLYNYFNLGLINSNAMFAHGFFDESNSL